MKNVSLDTKARGLGRSAYKKFCPANLSHCLKMDGNTIVMDKNKAIKTLEDKKQFLSLLYEYYCWDYDGDINDLTLYFEAGDNNTIIGGIYNETNHERVNKTLIAAPFYKHDPTALYICTEEAIVTFCRNIQKNP